MKYQAKKSPLVSVVLLNWNNSGETIPCLQSLEKVSYDNFNVLIVENGSSDNSFEKLQNFKEKSTLREIKILRNKKNLGFGGGNNTGINYALKHSTDYVLLLNNDTVQDPGFLTELVGVAQKNKNAGLVAPSIYFTEPDNLTWFGGKTKFKWHKMTDGAVVPLLNKKMPRHALPVKIDFATGACMLIKKEVLQKIKGFYPPYFLYFEDADISFAIKKAGYDLMWAPASKIWHKVSATTLVKVGPPGMNYYNNRNILLVSKRYGPVWVKYFYMHVWAVYKYIKQIVKFALGRNIEVSGAIKQGIEDYYKGKFDKYEKNSN